MRKDWEARWGLRYEGFIIGQYDDIDALIEDMRGERNVRFVREMDDDNGEFIEDDEWDEPDWNDLVIAAENNGDTRVTLAGYVWEIVDLDRY